jgi:hypothetical protein
MAYRLRPGVELVIVKGQDGLLRHHYAVPHGGVNVCGPYIPWLNAPAERDAHPADLDGAQRQPTAVC